MSFAERLAMVRDVLFLATLLLAALTALAMSLKVKSLVKSVRRTKESIESTATKLRDRFANSGR